MANEVNANIRVDIDSTAALASLRQLQSQISKFNQSVISTNAQAAASQRSMLSTMQAQIGATGQFTTSLTNVTTGVSRLQTAIDKNRLSLGEYFRYGAASSKTFGRMFGREHAEVMALATERVRKLQTQYIGLGEASGGMTKAMAVRPVSLFNADMAIGIQRSQLFNKLLGDGTTQLLNFGKNTQWAGRQLMVGFTIPLTIFGATASRIFMDLEKQAVAFRKVYGDIFTTEAETEQALEGIKELSVEFTKYGIAVKDSMALANIAAQAGFRNDQLIAATTQATRLSVLGQMESQEAMQTTISLQTAFGLSNEQLAEAVNFLNITENQSVLSLQDVAGAIPRVAPVINALGGDVKDLAVLLVAMKEGGVSAAEGANALKNSLGRLIVPTSNASRMAKDFGIDLEGIVTRNKGQVMPMLAELAQAMSTLDGFRQQQLLSTIFGKFQYARIGALFKSLQDDASQASRILQLTGLSTEQLAETAEKELGVIEEAVGTKFVAAMERAKVAIAPVGEQFLKLATPILNVVANIFEKFNELSPNIKNFVTLLVGGLGIITPVFIMLIGLTANFVANIAKGLIKFGQFMAKLKGGGDAVNYLSNEQIEAAAAAASLENRTTSLTSAINAQATALSNLTGAYGRYITSAQAAAANLPQGFRATPPLRGMATGGMVGGTGNKDSEPALLTPGEFVMNKNATKSFLPILDAMNRGTVKKLQEGSRSNFRVVGDSRFNVPAYGETAIRLQSGVENMARRAGALSLEDVLPVMALRTGEAAGIKPTVSQVARGSFDAIASQLQSVAQDFVNEVNAEFDRTAQTIKNADERMSAAWINAGKQVEQKISQLPAQVDKNVVRRYVGLDPDVYTTIPTDIRRAGETELTRARRGMFSTKAGGPRSYTSITTAARALFERRTGKSAAGMQMGHVFQPQTVNLQEVQRNNAMLTSSVQTAMKKIEQITQTTGISAAQNITKPIIKETAKAGKNIGPTLMSNARAASPPPWSTKLGTWIGQGIRQGTATQLKMMPEEIRRSINMGVSGPTSPLRGVPVSVAGQYFSGGAGAGGGGGGGEFIGMPMPNPPEDFHRNIEEANKQTRGFAKTMASLRNRASKFGGMLTGGSGALSTATIGLSSLTFGLSMMDNSVGEAAKKMMPFVFGITAVQQMLPMLATPMGALTVGLSALAVGAVVMSQKMKEMEDAGKKYIQALVGSSEKINEMAEFFGKQTYEQQLTGIVSRPLVEPLPDQETISKAAEFVQSETGKALLEDIQLVTRTSGFDKGIAALKNQLQRGILAGIIDPTFANEIAIQVANQLGDKRYAIEVNSQLKQILGPDGNKLQTVEGRIQLIADIIGEVKGPADVAKQAQEMFLSEDWLDQTAARLRSILSGGFGSGQEAQAMLQGQLLAEQTAQSYQLLNTEISKNAVEMLKSKIPFNEYIQNNITLAKELDKQEVGWRSISQQIKNYYGKDVVLAGQAQKEFKKNVQDSANDLIKQNLVLSQQEVLFDKLQKYVNTNFRMDLSVALTSGQLSPTEAITFFESLDKLPDDKRIEVDAKLEGLTGVQSAIFFSLLGAADGEISTEILLKLIQDNSIEELYKINAIAEALSASDINPKILLSLPDDEQQRQLDFIQKRVTAFDKLPKKNRKEREAEFLTTNFEVTDGQIRRFESMDDVTQRRVIIALSAIWAGDKTARDFLLGKGFSKDTVARMGQYAIPFATDLVLEETQESTVGAKGGGDGGGEGGGSKERSWLQQLIADTKANSKLFLDANESLKTYINTRSKLRGMLKQFKTWGIPEDIISQIGTGEEGLKRAQELQEFGKKNAKEFIKFWRKTTLGAFLKESDVKISEAEAKNAAKKILMEQEGLTESIAEAISSDSQTATQISTLRGAQQKQAIKKGIQVYEASTTAEERAIRQVDDSRKQTLDELSKKEALFRAELGTIDRQYQPIIKANQKRIEQLQDQISLVQKQIDEIEQLNKADQFRIRGLERQKEMLQRQLEEAERQNELDQRRIDTLKREDEIRNRVAESINKDLELVSQQEEKIREAYDQRFKALDKVAKVNDYIINQQKQQLNLSRAISEGDIFAATAAAQEMRAQSAQFSVEQTRAGLEAGMEGQIAGLRTTGGLTREQAEEQLRQIKEQSYQTSLLIRDVEDKIYERNLTLIPIKDQIRNIDNEIRSISDVIYDRETQVLQIQREKLDPLQSQLTSEQESLRNSERSLADAKAAVMIEGQTYEELQNQIAAEKEAYDVTVSMIKANKQTAESVNNIVKRWKQVTEQIAAANRVAKQSREQAEYAAEAEIRSIEAERLSPDESARRIAAANQRRADAIAAIETKRVEDIESYRQSGMSAIRGRYMGGLIKMGMGGKMRRYPMGGLIPYAMGGVAGDGGRDSVLAKLTPGEFVIRKAMVKKYGDAMMRDINMGSFSAPRYNTPVMADVKLEKVQNNNMIAPVYNNYDMDFTISGANASADEIANKVMFKMKQVQSSAIRTNRG